MKNLSYLVLIFVIIFAAMGNRVIEASETPEGAIAPETARIKYALVVNTKNTGKYSSDKIAIKEARRVFLKEITSWKKGLKAKPFFPKAGSVGHQALLKSVLGMSKAELARHWITKKNKNGVTSPKVIDTEKKTIKYVSRFEGSIGIVTLTAAKASGLRILVEL